MSNLAVNKTKSIFDEPETIKLTKKKFLKELKTITKRGGEISSFTTNTKSFEWADINTNVKKFFEKLEKFKFELVYVGVFYPKRKKTLYTVYTII